MFHLCQNSPQGRIHKSEASSMDPTGLSNAAYAFGQCFEVGFGRKIRNSWYIQLSMPNWWQDKGILIDDIDHRSCSRFSWCSADMCSQCCQLWHLQKHTETWTCVPGRRGIALAILAEDFPSHTACLDLGTFTSLLVWGLVPGSLSTRRGSLRFPLDSSIHQENGTSVQIPICNMYLYRLSYC